MLKRLLILLSALSPLVLAVSSASVSTVLAQTCTVTYTSGTLSSFIQNLPDGAVGCLPNQLFIENIGPTRGNYTLRSTDPANPATIGGYYYIRQGADNVTLRYLRLDGHYTSQIALQIFGNDFQLLDSEVTNAHLGSSCITLSNYEGTPSGPIYRTKILRNKIHGCGQAAFGQKHHAIYDAWGNDGEIADNVIEDVTCGWGFHLWTSAQNELYHHNLVRDAGCSGSGAVIIAGAAPNPSSNNVFEWNIFLHSPQYHVEEYWEKVSPGTGNVVRNNCLWAAGVADFAPFEGGYTVSNNVNQNPEAVPPGCIGYGPR